MKPKMKNPRLKRKQRVRQKISGTPLRPRLTVFRSLKYLSAQLIDDIAGQTIVAASTQEKSFRTGKGNTSVEGAAKLGAIIAERAKQKGVEAVVFDRSGYRYHGRIKALADAAREKGLKF